MRVKYRPSRHMAPTNQRETLTSRRTTRTIHRETHTHQLTIVQTAVATMPLLHIRLKTLTSRPSTRRRTLTSWTNCTENTRIRHPAAAAPILRTRTQDHTRQGIPTRRRIIRTNRRRLGIAIRRETRTRVLSATSTTSRQSDHPTTKRKKRRVTATRATINITNSCSIEQGTERSITEDVAT